MFSWLPALGAESVWFERKLLAVWAVEVFGEDVSLVVFACPAGTETACNAPLWWISCSLTGGRVTAPLVAAAAEAVERSDGAGAANRGCWVQATPPSTAGTCDAPGRQTAPADDGARKSGIPRPIVDCFCELDVRTWRRILPLGQSGGGGGVESISSISCGLAWKRRIRCAAKAVSENSSSDSSKLFV